MAEKGPKDENHVGEISALNLILENVISDASELVKDLYWGVKSYLFFGVVSFAFGLQTIIYNMDSLQARLYIPVFVGGAMIFSGLVQILNYFRLRAKYAQLFKTQNDLRRA